MPGFAALPAVLLGAQGAARADAPQPAASAPGDFAALIGAAGEAPLPLPPAQTGVAAQGQSSVSEDDLPPPDLPSSLAWLPARIETLAVPGGLRPEDLAEPARAADAAATLLPSPEPRVPRPGTTVPSSESRAPSPGILAALGGSPLDDLAEPAQAADAAATLLPSPESRVTSADIPVPSSESRVASPGIIGLAAATTELHAPPQPPQPPMSSTLLHAAAPQFAGDLAERIVWQLEGGVGEARIELHPAELGSISVHIETQGDQARVQIVAAEAATRALLSQALPQLRELLSGSGLQLARSSIDAERRAERGGERGAMLAPMPGVRRRVTQVLLVDAYA
ncbi:MAG: flagellar hook-length control protein FliK [Pseudomonadota bacterium]